MLDLGYQKLHVDIEVSQISSSCLTLVTISFIWILKSLRSTAVARPWLSKAAYGYLSVSDQQQLLDLGNQKLHMDIEVSQINSSCLTLVIISFILILKCLRSTAVAGPWLS